MIGHGPDILFISLACSVVAWLVASHMVVWCWSWTFVCVLVKGEIGHVVDRSAGLLFVALVVKQNHREEVRFVVWLVQKLVVQMVSSAYDQWATNYLRAVWWFDSSSFKSSSRCPNVDEATLILVSTLCVRLRGLAGFFSAI